MDLKDIKAIIDLMKKNSINEFELEKDQFKIKLRRELQSKAAPATPVTVIEAPAAAAPAQAAPAAAAAPANDGVEIKSPMIGTFYRSPSPDAGPYVEVGSEVGPDTVVCIIEAMKVMNEIKAEQRGVITSMLVENGNPVEFGQALYKIRPL
ncbi:MAG: acetyl-CoA carboxylase biotin carboxyl carrier protein [Limisphaerales bacterium]